MTADSRTRTSFAELDTFTGTADGAPVYSFDLDRDLQGRIATKTETIEGVTSVWEYSYHPQRGWLTEVKKDAVVVETYSYDDNGNRTSWTDFWGGGTASYDAQDRMLTSGPRSYEYTKNGELLTKTAGPETTDYTYDVRGALLSVDLPTGIAIDYVVDSSGRRIGKKVNGTLVQGWIYAGGLAPVAETDSTGTVTSQFVYATKGNVPEYLIKGGTTYRIFTDHLTSVRLVVNTTDGTIAQRLDYDAYGRVIADSNPGFQPFGFAGGLYDSQTGLTRFGARDYDPETGRWTAKDPIGFAGGSAGLYEYCANDSVNHVDPTGLTDWLDGVQLGLDVAGLVPGIGEVADGANALISLGRGNYGDAALSAAAMVPLVGMAATLGKGAKHADDVVDICSGAASARSGFRRGLANVTGVVPDAAHAHHMLPVKFQEEFAAAGIDIRDPKYGAWWEATGHLSNAHGYNEAWAQYLVPGRSSDEILAFGKELAAKYGLTVNY